ncbi:DUF6308 family protein [Brevibacterium yomogidense]|uniref:DUF6308 family protein n=1 Tax=Brevibacterium yomogidense TaxID=946573 RepID=UPI0018DF2449|nr:DUF6308 family protein [Brevibacterium yomogidense]
MSIIEAVRRVSDEQARVWAETYYGRGAGQTPYTGAYFEQVGTGTADPNTINSSDLYAASCLAVHIPAPAGVGLLFAYAEDIRTLLSQVPSCDLREITETEYEDTLGLQSPAQKLWELLRAAHRDRWGVGPTRASKIFARKRPHLIPIEDSVVNRVIGLGRADSWRVWWEAFQEDGDYLEERAETVRVAASRPNLSSLRALDVMLWMSGRESEG